ncbi:MAG: alpha-glucosidase C-terminal domain-containing protein [Candidatus Sulfotelmatobacter sp.]
MGFANLSRFAQPVDLGLSKVEGMTPVETLGYVEFPPIDRHPYRLTLASYSFLWPGAATKREAHWQHCGYDRTCTDERNCRMGKHS